MIYHFRAINKTRSAESRSAEHGRIAKPDSGTGSQRVERQNPEIKKSSNRSPVTKVQPV